MVSPVIGDRPASSSLSVNEEWSRSQVVSVAAIKFDHHALTIVEAIEAGQQIVLTAGQVGRYRQQVMV